MSEPATMNREAREILLRARHKQRQDALAVERLKEFKRRRVERRVAKVGPYKPAVSTLKGKLLAVAGTLDQPFTLTALVISAWVAYPCDFCLPGAPAHVDSHKIFACLCGSRGLVDQGFMVRTGKNEYRVVQETTNGHA